MSGATNRDGAARGAAEGHDKTARAGQAPSLKLRRKPVDRAPLVRLTWPAQPVLGSLDFDDTEAG